MLNGLDLFSGIGGISLALSEWVRPVAYCEIEPYAAGVLFSRMLDGTLPRAPIFPDIRHLTTGILPSIDIVYGGFPCQPYSTAARGRNKPDTMQKELSRIINETKPTFVFAENVKREAFEGLAESISDYKCEIKETDAADLGAPHIRRRYWLLGYSYDKRESALQEHEEVAMLSSYAENIWTEIKSSDLRMDDGIPFRMDRIKGLGNAVVPLCAKEAFKELIGIK